MKFVKGIEKLERGVELQKQFKFLPAKKQYLEFYKQNPTDIRALRSLAKIHFLTNNKEESKKFYTKAIKLYPNDVALLDEYGEFLYYSNAYQKAIEIYLTLTDNKPINYSWYDKLAECYYELNNFERALFYCTESLGQNNSNKVANLIKVQIFRKLGKIDQAIQILSDLVHRYPNDYDILNRLGVIHWLNNDTSEAIDFFKKAIDACPKILDNKIHLSEIYHNLGLCYIEEGDVDNAMTYNLLSIEQNPNNYKAHYNLAYCHLIVGKFEQGWYHFEYRKYIDEFTFMFNYNFGNAILWTGQEIYNKNIFVFHEQGYGDSIHFVRYLRFLKDKGANIFFGIVDELFDLFKTVPGINKMIHRGGKLPKIDYYCSLLSLPGIFKTDKNFQVWYGPYIKANNSKSEYWKQKLSQFKKIKIGLVWKSGIRYEDYLRRSADKKSIPLTKLCNIKTNNCDFFSIQKGNEAKKEFDLITKAENYNGITIHDFTSEFNTFEDTAAFIDNLDIVISICTSVAHLAGAMGKPTWLLLDYSACWRWKLNTDRTDWYPSMKIFRQNERKNWDTVIEAITKHLEDITNERRKNN